MEQVNRTGPRFGAAFLPRNATVLTFVAISLTAPCMVHAAERLLEYEVKGAFLLNFTKFIEWPGSAFSDTQSPMAICVLGKDPFGRVLDEIVQGESVSARKVTVRRINEAPRPQACQVVFIGGGDKDVRRTLNSIPGNVLTVGEGEAFLREGGMIAFVLENHRVRFDINQSAAEKAELKFSSRLLSVARSVEKIGSEIPPG